MPMLRIRSKGVFRDMSLTVPFFERKRFGTRPDLVFVAVCESFFQAVKKRGDRHPQLSDRSRSAPVRECNSLRRRVP